MQAAQHDDQLLAVFVARVIQCVRRRMQKFVGQGNRELFDHRSGIVTVPDPLERAFEFAPAHALGVVAQRLVRVLCPACKEKHELEDSAWELLVSPWKAQKPDTTYIAKGCLECRMTGYVGRIGVYEMMVLNNEIKGMITDTTDMDKLRELSYREGVKPLRINGAMKVAAGVTTVEEILKTVPPPTGDRRSSPR